MRRIIFIIFTFNLTIAFNINAQKCDELMVCGSSRLFIVKVQSLKDTIPNVIWEWNAHEAQDLPIAYRNNFFEKISECKSFNKGNDLLITASTGGVALIDRETNKVKFYAFIPNAHSAELLPDNRIVVAGSLNNKGNCLEVFDISQSENSLFRDSLYLGHGVIWDAARKTLYALGYDRINQYKLKNWDTRRPALKLFKRTMLPSFSGHELQRYQSEDILIISTAQHVWLFDKATSTFKPFRPLADRKDVKSTSYNDYLKLQSYTVAEHNWWTHRVYFLGTDRFLSFPGVNVYKAHWINK